MILLMMIKYNGVLIILKLYLKNGDHIQLLELLNQWTNHGGILIWMFWKTFID